MLLELFLHQRHSCARHELTQYLMIMAWRSVTEERACRCCFKFIITLAYFKPQLFGVHARLQLRRRGHRRRPNHEQAGGQRRQQRCWRRRPPIHRDGPQGG